MNQIKKINAKSWDQILAENTFQFQPPCSVHIPIQPVHSPDFIHVDSAMNVIRRRVTDKVSLLDKESFPKARNQGTFIVQFAFESPAFVPDFRQSAISLEEGKYPIITAKYFAWDIYYQMVYSCTKIDEEQSLLWIEVSIKNESEKNQKVNVWTGINFEREDKLFKHHYIPFTWDATNWNTYKGLKLKDNTILKDKTIFGKVFPGMMKVKWVKAKSFRFTKQNKKCLGHETYYVVPSMRLKYIHNAIHASAELKPGEKRSFSVALLTNDTTVTKKHISTLKNSTAKGNKDEAIVHFKSQFTKSNTELIFPLNNWQEKFTQMQTSALQLLVKYPEKTNLMPTQGGTTERFFVWVWEAVHMLQPMLRTGMFASIRKALDYIFSLQDAGCPPEGRFTTTEGSIGTTGPKWICTTGSALALASAYYLYSKDEGFLKVYMPKILKAINWIVGELRATRKLNSDGSRPQYYGLMPFGCATDGDIGYIIAMTDGYTFSGLEKAVKVLEQFRHKDAAEFRRELELYREDLKIAIGTLTQPDGFIDRKIQIDDKDVVNTSKFRNVGSSAKLGLTGAINPDSEIFRNFIKYYEENRAVGYFMGNMDREIAYVGMAEYVWQHIYLILGEWKKAFAVTQINLKYGMTQDTYQVQERFSRQNPAFTPWQPNGSGAGRMLDMMLNSLYFETDKGITLLGGIPFSWLQANQKIKLNNLYTKTGIINLRVEATTSKTCKITLSSVDGSILPNLIRFPEYLNAVEETSSITNKGHGFFELNMEEEI
jgi:hypothetical protein